METGTSPLAGEDTKPWRLRLGEVGEGFCPVDRAPHQRHANPKPSAIGFTQRHKDK